MSIKLTTNEFIERAKLKHDNKYNYSKVEYINSKTKVIIICPIHGEFEQKPYNHLYGQGCPKCKTKLLSDKFKNKQDDIIKKFNIKHNNKYDYSKVEYINLTTPIAIICPIHGEFEQTPSNHLTGRGCPKCKQSHIENGVERLLIENNIEYIPQKRFNWLRLQSLDFYLPQHHIAIECQGRQHFERIEMFDKRYTLEERIELDYNKQLICSEHNIKILYLVPLNSQLNEKIYNEYNTYYNINQLIEDIKKAT